MKKFRLFTMTWLAMLLVSATTSVFSAKVGTFGGNGIPLPDNPPDSKAPVSSSVNWNEVKPAGDIDELWQTSGISADGQTILVGTYEGRLYLTTDGGMNWAETQPAGDTDILWNCVTVSGDGLTMLAGIEGGRLYLSADGGNNWSEKQPAGDNDQLWISLAVSFDGTTILISCDGNNSMYLSTDQGLSWKTTGYDTPDPVPYTWVSMSSNGNYMLATNQNEYIFISGNGGETWVSVDVALDWWEWVSASMSADGSTMIAATLNDNQSNGRVFISTDYGVNWTETQPYGDNDLDWLRVAISGDGSVMLAGMDDGALFISTDKGGNWSETKPDGHNYDEWRTISVASNGIDLLAGIYDGRLYKGIITAPPNVIFGQTPVFDQITFNSAHTKGEITSTNGADATNVGGIIYTYTNTDKSIGDTGVTQEDSTGTFGTGEFPVSFTGLSANTRYNARIYATNSAGTGYSARSDFWTLANVPETPTLNNVTATTLDITIDANGNPDSTLFAIQDSINSTYVQADGSLAATTVWKTATAWGTKTIAGLTTGTTYFFRVKAKNGVGTETTFSSAAMAVPVAKPIVSEFGNSFWSETQPAGDNPKNWMTVSISADGMTMLAADFMGRLYLSKDKGNTWLEKQPDGDSDLLWSSVSVSGDGSTLLAGIQQGRLYLSTDNGDTWTETQPAGNVNAKWISLATSTNGATILAGTDDSTLYLSVNQGGFWSEVQPGGDYDYQWRSVSVSGDGTRLLAAAKNKRLYFSTDHGINWNELRPAGDVDKKWQTVALSKDGNVLAAGVENGRLYLSTDGGVNWSEQQPAGNADKKWWKIAVSGDGSRILAAVLQGRLYETNDSGANWSEAQPAGNADKQWSCIAVSANSLISVTGIVFERLYVYDFKGVDSISTNSARGNGKIQSTEGADVSNRGFILYPFTGVDKNIGDTDVVNVDENGVFGNGVFTSALTGLSVNTHYNIRTHATNSIGIGYSDRKNFWTLANVPGQPTLDNVSATSIDVTLDTNSNPAYTEFAIRVTYDDGSKAIVSKYLKSGTGSLQDSIDWQTNSVWGTITAGGLETGKEYTFAVKARNGDFVETAFCTGESAITCSNPTNGGEIGTNQNICEGSTPGKLTNEAGASNYAGTLEYKWQYSTTSDTEGFADIDPTATDEEYSPGVLNDSTWFKRLARVDCKPDWTGAAESNVVKINLAPAPVAFAGSDASIVEGKTYTLTDASAENYISVTWMTTLGDGTFNCEILLNPTYTPGDNDKLTGSVEICLLASPVSPCATGVVDTMNLAIWRHPSVEITSPGQKDVLYSNPVTITGTADDADDNLNIIEVKLNSGNWQTTTGTTNWTIDLDLLPGKNTLEARAKDATNLYSDTVNVSVTLSIQVITIPQGWSYISSYLKPSDSNIVNMWADIVGANHLGILTGVQGIYAPPPLCINTLGNWDVLKGYKVKMSVQDELIVSGDSLVDKTVPFSAGVHLIPVLTNQTTPLDEVILSPATDVLYMLDIYSNLVYWPGGGINTLTELVPGKGYLANFKNPLTLTYPPMSNFILDDATSLPPAPGPWACNRTSNVHLISVSFEAIKDLQNAGYIGAFDSQGYCVGYAALEKSGQNILLTVFGDEPLTTENDGLAEGELIHFRSFNINENTEKELTPTFNPSFTNADGLFYVNGLSGISGFKESSTVIDENDFAASVEVYPNPAKDVVSITLTGFNPETSGLSGLKKGLTATLLTAEGKVVKTFYITGKITSIDISSLNPGMYLLKITAEDKIFIKRLIVNNFKN